MPSQQLKNKGVADASVKPERALKKLAEKSRVAASALPHALYVAAVLGGRRAFPERFGNRFGNSDHWILKLWRIRRDVSMQT